jgi:iodotyrosine deiodinase
MQPHDAVPLADHERLDADAMLQRAQGFHTRMSQRHSVRDFSSDPVPRSVIEHCVLAAGTAPSGANQQPWFFACVGSADLKSQIRAAAEVEERAFYAGQGGIEWLRDLSPLGTDADKPYLELAPWLIVIFGQRKVAGPEGTLRKSYYMNESVGIATGMLITALHTAGLATLTHTPSPMTFLNDMCGRPVSEKPYLILVTGYPAANATVPVHSLAKKPLGDVASFL